MIKIKYITVHKFSTTIKFYNTSSSLKIKLCNYQCFNIILSGSLHRTGISLKCSNFLITIIVAK